MGAHVLELDAVVEVVQAPAFVPPATYDVVFDTRATKGLHPAVPVIAATIYAAIVAVFWTGFVSSVGLAFPMLIVTLVLVAFFGGPLVLDSIRVGFRQRHGVFEENPGSFGRFLAGHFGTASGPVSGIEALVLVATVPLCLLVAAIAFAVIYHVV